MRANPAYLGFDGICRRFEIIISATERILAAAQTIIPGTERSLSATERGPRRRIDNHLQDGKNRLADRLHSRCEGNNVREAIEDYRRNGNHYRRGFNKPVWIGNDRDDCRFHRWSAFCRCVRYALV